MKQRLLLPLLLLLLLLSVGLVMANTSSTYELQRFATMSGGTASSASYTVNVVIGQPATSVGSSANYAVSSGFLRPETQLRGGHEIMLPAIFH